MLGCVRSYAIQCIQEGSDLLSCRSLPSVEKIFWGKHDASLLAVSFSPFVYKSYCTELHNIDSPLHTAFLHAVHFAKLYSFF